MIEAAVPERPQPLVTYDHDPRLRQAAYLMAVRGLPIVDPRRQDRAAAAFNLMVPLLRIGKSRHRLALEVPEWATAELEMARLLTTLAALVRAARSRSIAASMSSRVVDRMFARAEGLLGRRRSELTEDEYRCLADTLLELQQTFPHRKSCPDPPPNLFVAEAAGLAWLAAAAAFGGGVAAVKVLHVDQAGIELARVVREAPSHADAETFGRQLAATHRSGAPWHGAPPPDLQLNGYIAGLPLPYRRLGEQPWGRFFASQRIAPYVRMARDVGRIDARGVRTLDRLCARLDDGDARLVAGGADIARLHGDLRPRNVLWTPRPVLISPAAHGGHRETDLATWCFRGSRGPKVTPCLDRVIAAYHESWPLTDGFIERRSLHQVHLLLVRTVVSGGMYGGLAVAAAAQYV